MIPGTASPQSAIHQLASQLAKGSGASSSGRSVRLPKVPKPGGLSPRGGAPIAQPMYGLPAPGPGLARVSPTVAILTAELATRPSAESAAAVTEPGPLTSGASGRPATRRAPRWGGE